MAVVDSRFTVDNRFPCEGEAGPSTALHSQLKEAQAFGDVDTEPTHDLAEGMDPQGFFGPSEKVVKPLTQEALAAYKAAQDRAGVIYISRIPPGMQPAKVRHFMSAYGEIGRVYLQPEDAKRAYLRRKFTTTKKPHFIEGWVEFKDKKVARSVAEMLNAQPIGGKKGTRWRDDVWTMKYLPKFKWNMLTEQVAHEAALHAARLRMELSQSRAEQRDYLKNVELARVLDKRARRKTQSTGVDTEEPNVGSKRPATGEVEHERKRKDRERAEDFSRDSQLDNVLGRIF